MAQFTDRPCEVLKCKKRRVICERCEPHVWLVMIMEAEHAPEASVRDSALRLHLQQLYRIHVLLHGPIQLALDKDPTLRKVRSQLGPLAGSDNVTRVM